MKETKTIVVVGGVAGGMSFATRYRRLNPHDHIIILEKGPYVSFANCGLPYYISEEITDRNDLLVAPQAMLEQRFNFDIRVNNEVISINKDKSITIKNEEGEYLQSYDELILSVGAKPIYLDIPGMNPDSIFTLRNIPDADKIVAYIDDNKPKNAIVIGAGFIGLEMAENLRKKGMHVSIVEKAPHILPPLDIEMSVLAKDELLNHEIKVYTNTSVTSFDNDEAILEDGTRIQADLVIMAIGVLPDTHLAKEAGITLGAKGGIVVSDTFETSMKHVYAIGDAIIVKHTITHEPVLIPLASPANRQGRHLADILSGISHKNTGSLGTAILRLFNLTIATTGLNERQLKDVPYQAIHLLSNQHAGYFPGAKAINLKIIYSPKTLEILGAQAIGEDGVDKRIDVIATVIKLKGTVLDLQDLELAYAPPFGSAKDIVNMAGYVAENIHTKLTNTIQWYEIDTLPKETFLLDVREALELETDGKIKGAHHIPLSTLRENYKSLPKDKPIVVYCRSGVRSYNAERFLKGEGYDVRNLDGSFSTYARINPEGIEHV